MSFIVEGFYADWEVLDEGVSTLQMAIDWAIDVGRQDEVKVRVIDERNNKVVWVR
jgi:hypothetical protein